MGITSPRLIFSWFLAFGGRISDVKPSFVRLVREKVSQMSRAAQIFRQTDVAKALRAAQNAGLDVWRFEIDRAGKITVIASKQAPEADLLDEEGRPIMVHPRQAAAGA
jgi:hypothetical protein